MRSINEIIVHCSATREGQHIPVETSKELLMKARGWTDMGVDGKRVQVEISEKDCDIYELRAYAKENERNSIGIQ